MMPSTRLTTLAPVTPRNLITRTALSSTTRKKQHRRQCGDHARRFERRAGAAHQQHDRGERARPRQQREREREDRDIGAALRLFLLRHGRRADARAPREHHVGRKQEEQNPAGDAEGGKGDAQRLEHILAEKPEDQEQHRGDGDGAQRGAAAELVGRAAGQGREHGRGAHGVDDDEKRDETVGDRERHRFRTRPSIWTRGSSPRATVS